MKATSCVGRTYGQLTILEELDPHITPNGSKQRIVKCQCACGNVVTERLQSAIKSKKCRACASKERRTDLTGKRFGKLVVLSMGEDYLSPSGHRLSQCRCICDCGKTTTVTMSSLVRGTTQSCGCIHNTCGLLKDNAKLVRKYDFLKNNALGIDINDLTARSSKKVWWKCDTCGCSWLATIASQNDKIEHGCPYCSGRAVIKGKTDLLSMFPEIAQEWNYEKNNSLFPSDVSAKSNSKVWWVCNEGHEWQATISNRTNNNSGCPRCNIEKVNSFCEQAVFYYVKRAFPDTINGDKHINVELDLFIPSLQTAVEYDGEAWHRSEKRMQNDLEKNKACDAAGIKLIRIREPRLPKIENCVTIIRADSSTSKSLNDAIKMLLSILGESNIVVDTDSDCGYILELYAVKKQTRSLAYCSPSIAAEWHPIKNGNLTPDKIYNTSNRKVWWLGKCGHEWQMSVCDRTRIPAKQTPGKRVKKPYGCPYCSGKRILDGFNDLQTTFPQVASEWHPSKNGDLNPTDISYGSKKVIWWQCINGHEWKATPNHRCGSHQNCPICYKENRSPAVKCIDTGEVFRCGADAARFYGGTNASSIYKCCRGLIKTAFGQHWSFNDNDEK